MNTEEGGGLRAAPSRMSIPEARDLALEWTRFGVPAAPAVLSWDEAKGSISKRPVGEHGVKGATLDENELRALFRKVHLASEEAPGVFLWPEAGGYLVIDIDIKGGARGDEELVALEDRFGRLPATMTVLTASGGFHLWFRVPQGSQYGHGDLAPDVEVPVGVIAGGTRTPWGSWEVELGG